MMLKDLNRDVDPFIRIKYTNLCALNKSLMCIITKFNAH